MKKYIIRLFTFTLILLILESCSSKEEEITTPKKFVEVYSMAFKEEDVDKIIKLKWRPKNVGNKDDPSYSEEIELLDRVEEREQIVKDIKSKGIGYTFWTKAKYDGERDHGDHIHVRMRLDTLYEFTLIREGKLLKYDPRPGWFKD